MINNDTPLIRQALHIDPLRACQPLGAVYAALGVHACIPLSHGSSGCSRFQKDQIGKHLHKIIRLPSSMLKESSAIFGGKENLLAAAKNIYEYYSPEVIAVHSTCLSETIGDDVEAIIKEVEVPDGKHIVCAVTPSYVSSHIAGYAGMVEAFIRQLASGCDQKKDKVFIISGLVNPGDAREIKRIAAAFSGEFCLFPDVSERFDVATPIEENRYSEGGTPVEEIIHAGECSLVISLGFNAAQKGAEALSHKFEIECANLDIPIGVEATDRYTDALYRFYRRRPSDWLEKERKQLLDIVMDMEPLLFKKRFAVSCDPDVSLPLCEFLAGIGMIPAYVFTGPDSKDFEERMDIIFRKYGTQGTVKCNTDLYDLEHCLKDSPVDLLIGDVRAKHTAHRLDLPFMRFGFPVTDRLVHPYLPVAGYRGAFRILEMISNTLLDRQDCDRPVDQLTFSLPF